LRLFAAWTNTAGLARRLLADELVEASRAKRQIGVFGSPPGVVMRQVGCHQR